MLNKGKSMANDDYDAIDLRNPLEDLNILPRNKPGLSAEVCEKLDAATVNDLLKSAAFHKARMTGKVKKMLKKTMTYEAGNILSEPTARLSNRSIEPRAGANTLRAAINRMSREGENSAEPNKQTYVLTNLTDSDESLEIMESL